MFSVGAFCLMPTHAHLLLKRGEVPVAKAMQRVQSVFAHKYNKPRSRIGHVFQGRYHAFVVSNDRYLLSLLRYIHMNPVRAGLVEDPGDWEYSSHGYYWAREGMCDFVRCVPGLGGGAGVAKYRALMSQGRTSEELPTYGVFIGEVEDIERLGDEMFIDRRCEHRAIEEAVSAYCREAKVDPSAIRSRDRRRPIAQERTRLLSELYAKGYQSVAVARYFGISPAAVLDAARRNAVKLH